MRQAYFATTSYIDHEVGRVLSTLEEEGLVGDTIIVLLGDHGECEDEDTVVKNTELKLWFF